MIVAGSVVSLLLAGCLDAGSAQLVGSWQMQTADEVARRLDSTDPAQQAWSDVIQSTDRLFRRVGGAAPMGQMTLEFRADGVMDTVTEFPQARGQKSFRWKVRSFDRATQTAVVQFERIIPGSTATEATQTQIQFVHPDTIVLVPPNLDAIGMKLMFQRRLQ